MKRKEKEKKGRCVCACPYVLPVLPMPQQHCVQHTHKVADRLAAISGHRDSLFSPKDSIFA